MEYLNLFLDLFRDLKGTLQHWVDLYHAWVYLILFVILFCETGLVVTPFLPGDSLLFAAGTFTIGTLEQPAELKLLYLILLLSAAAVLGDAVNFAAGFRIGPKVFTREDSFWLNKKHLLQAQSFYEKYGGKTIILARFVPIVRTFAPFVAGIGKMTYVRFASFNVIGGVAWVTICLTGGRFFGGLPFVQKHFELVLVTIVLISVMPAVIEYLRERSKNKAAAA
ncbi:MAG: DedA family protein [Myxococcales bacterium]|nr:DedA family protein [Myxococcales bacterium]